MKLGTQQNLPEVWTYGTNKFQESENMVFKNKFKKSEFE